jgi:hypothetical protein
LLIWQEKEADLLKCVKELSREHNEFLAVITKGEEENIKLSLSIESIQLQVKSLEKVYMNSKLQDELKMNELESKYHEEKNMLQLELSSMKTMCFNVSKENENLTLNKIHMQEQLDALSLQVETLNKKLTIVSSEKDNLIISNNAFKIENILQKKTLKEYKQLENTRIKEFKDKTNSITTKVSIFKQGVLALNKTLSNAKIDIKALKIQLLVNYKMELIFLIILGVLAILQNAYKKKKKNSNQNIINTIELTSYIQSNHEKKFELTHYSEEKEKVHYFDNVQQIKNSNINKYNENCKMIVVVRNVKNEDVILNLKNKNEKQSYIKNEKCGTHLIDLNHIINVFDQNTQKSDKHYFDHKKCEGARHYFISLILWSNHFKYKILNTIKMYEKFQFSYIFEKSNIALIMINDLYYYIYKKSLFHNKNCNWNFKINPYIWDPGI